MSIQISASTLVSSLGQGKLQNFECLKQAKTGLKKLSDSFDARLDSYFGEVANLEAVQLPKHLKAFNCRNHQLAWLALQTDDFSIQVQLLKKKYGTQRIGLAVGTSTSGILATEQVLKFEDQYGYFNPDYHYEKTHRMNALADFCAAALEIEGPRMVISTACSSSAKVFASAARWLEHGLVDAVVVGGVDTLCLTTIHGFNALGLITQDIVCPLDANRNGINIGEAGGFMLLEKSTPATQKVQLTGYGETSDAYHISTPHPEGRGAKDAMRNALNMANLQPNQIDYLNLHGTGTPSNDLAEANAIHQVFKNDLPALSSTKGYTGHTLGAAGIVEAIFCELALQHQCHLPNLNLQNLDPELNLQPVTQFISAALQHCMSNSFGFGGNNASLIFSRMETQS